MANLSPKTKLQVHQINVFKKATGRSKRMVTAELVKGPPPAKKKSPVKGSGTTSKSTGFKGCTPRVPRTTKRTRAEDHVYDSSGAPEARPEVRRSVVKRISVGPEGAPDVDEVGPTRSAQSNAVAPDSEPHQRSFPFPSPSDKDVLLPSPARLASMIESPTSVSDVQPHLSNGVMPNGYGHRQAVVMDVETGEWSDHSPVVEAYRFMEIGGTCAAVHADPTPTAQIQECSTAISLGNGFENLLKRVGCSQPVCATTVSSTSVSPVSGVYNDSDAEISRPAVQGAQRRPASPEYIAAPSYYHGLWNLGNTCYMNTVIQLLYNLESFTADLALAAKLPLRRDGISLGLKEVFQTLARSTSNEVIYPTCLQRACEKYMTDFQGSVQQDAQEFLLNVLDKIAEEIANGQKGEEFQTVHPESTCPTTRNFSCKVRNILSCEGCDNIVNLDQSARHFSLPLPQDRRDPQAEIPDIEAMMNLYFQAETLSFKCEKCGAETMKSETKIVQLPRVLILHINRFEIDRHMLCSKVSIPVKFHESLDLAKWCLEKVRGPRKPDDFAVNGGEYVNGDLPALEDCHENTHSNGCHSNGDRLADPQELMDGTMFHRKENGFRSASPDFYTRYNLHGVVSHVGKLASSGHYTADIFDIDLEKYVRCDDSIVREVSPADVFCEEKLSEAYVLLYVLQQHGDLQLRL